MATLAGRGANPGSSAEGALVERCNNIAHMYLHKGSQLLELSILKYYYVYANDKKHEHASQKLVEGFLLFIYYCRQF
jgi:hypothetical protein